MKTRWGSCNINRRNINLNLELAKRPFVVIEYVILHELSHLVERTHNKRFTSLVEKYIMEINQLGTSETIGFELTENQTSIKKEPSKKALNLNGGNYVVNLELYLNKLKAELSEKTSQKVIFMLKFLQERKIA